MCAMGTTPSTLPTFLPPPPPPPSLPCISHIAYGLRSMGYSSRCEFVSKEQSEAGANPSGRKGGVKYVMVFAN